MNTSENDLRFNFGRTQKCYLLSTYFVVVNADNAAKLTSQAIDAGLVNSDNECLVFLNDPAWKELPILAG